MPNLAQYARPSIAVSQRIPSFMCHTFDLYRPKAYSAYSSGEMGDFSYEPFPAYSGVVGHLQATPEFDDPQLQGMTKQVSVLTSDRLHFLAEQEVADTWLVVMRTVGNVDYGNAWIIQGNATMNASQPGRPADSQWLPSKLAPDNTIPTASYVNTVTRATATAVVH